MLKTAAARGYDGVHDQKPDLLPGKALARKAFSEGRAAQVSDVRTADQFAVTLQAENPAHLAQMLVEEPLPASAVAAPIYSEQQKYGVLVVENYSGESTFQPEHFQAICLAADLIALAAGEINLSAQDPGEPHTYRQDPVSLDMLDALGHELQLPLTAIKGFATALLLEDVDWSPSKRKEFLQLIDEECDRMEVLLKNCLDSAAGDFSQMVLDRQTVSVTEIASQVAAEIRARTTIHQIIVEFPAAFPQLSVDPNWIRQIFRNLLDNAVKYSPDGGLIVMRGSVRQADVLLSISDQGIGISPEDIIPLFERYHRAKISTDLGIPGKGLGLPITRMVVEAHGGRIWAYSRLGQGTTMYFTLPLDHMDSLEGQV
jgi:K+-sensing histidine kinase KdpD